MFKTKVKLFSLAAQSLLICCTKPEPDYSLKTALRRRRQEMVCGLQTTGNQHDIQNGSREFT